MLRLAVVLAALAAATQAFAAPQQRFVPQPQFASVGCPDIDPGFVKYVPPATRADGSNSLLWLVGGTVADLKKAEAKPAYSLSTCVRPLQTRLSK